MGHPHLFLQLRSVQLCWTLGVCDLMGRPWAFTLETSSLEVADRWRRELHTKLVAGIHETSARHHSKKEVKELFLAFDLTAGRTLMDDSLGVGTLQGVCTGRPPGTWTETPCRSSAQRDVHFRATGSSAGKVFHLK